MERNREVTGDAEVKNPHDLGGESNKKSEANGNANNGDGERKGEEGNREMEANRKGKDGVRQRKGEERENPGRSMVVRGRESQFPPDDDCCPICFGDFQIPCKTNCGHWFCANCILTFWKYSASFLKRCKCPICCCLVSKLTPEASLTLQREVEVVEALKSVEGYNCLFVGGARGLMMKLRHFVRRFYRGLLDPDRAASNLNALRLIGKLLHFVRRFYRGLLDPDIAALNLNALHLIGKLLHFVRRFYRGLLDPDIAALNLNALRLIGKLLHFVRRFYRGLLDPDRAASNLNALRLIGLLLASLYELCGFDFNDFLPTGDGAEIVDLIDYWAMALVLILLLVGLCRTLILALRARRMAAVQP